MHQRCFQHEFYLLKRTILNMKLLKSSKSETVLSIENGQLALPHPSFHNTISFVITLAQFFGVMPLYGMSEGDIHHIKFKWKSLRFLYTMYNFSGALISSLFCCTRFAMHGLMLDKTGKSFLYYVQHSSLFVFQQLWHFTYVICSLHCSSFIFREIGTQ